MGIAAAIVGIIGVITTILGILNILQIPADPLISAKLTWTFWFGLSGLLFLGAMVLLMGRRTMGD